MCTKNKTMDQLSTGKKQKCLENALQKFSCMKQGERMLSGLNRQRLENHEICDVNIQSSDGDVCCAHMCVLINSSGYFKALYEGRAISESGARKVVIPELDSSTVSDILTFLYTGQIKLNMDNVQDLLQGADFLLIDDLKEKIREYLCEILSVENCLDLLVTSDIYRFDDIKKDTIEIVKSRFHDYIIHTDAVLHLCGHELSIIFLQDKVQQVVDKTVMQEILVKWSRQNITKNGVINKSDAHVISKLVQVYKVDLEEASELKNLIGFDKNNIIEDKMTEDDCPKALENEKTVQNRTFSYDAGGGGDDDDEAYGKSPKKVKKKSGPLLSYYLSRDSGDEGVTTTSTACRVGSGTAATVGFEPIATPTFDDLTQEKEKEDMFREDVAKMIRTGEENTEEDIDLVVVNGLGDRRNFAYIVQQNRWTQLPSLPDTRTNHKMAHLGKKLYMFGGNQVAYIPCEQILDLDSLTWSSLPPTRHMHLFPQVALPLNNKLYLLGNRGNGEIFHPVENTWTPMARYQQESYEVILRAVVHDDAIYACFSEYQDRSGSLAQYLNDRPRFAKYNPLVDEWTLLSSHVLDRSIGLLTEYHTVFTEGDHFCVAHYTHRNRRGVVYYKINNGILTDPMLELHSLRDPDQVDNAACSHHRSVLVQWDRGMCMLECDQTIPDCSRTYRTVSHPPSSSSMLYHGAPPPFMFGREKHMPVLCHVKVAKSLVTKLLSLRTAKYKLS